MLLALVIRYIPALPSIKVCAEEEVAGKECPDPSRPSPNKAKKSNRNGSRKADRIVKDRKRLGQAIRLPVKWYGKSKYSDEMGKFRY
jgi:hypothetical protein